jgi:hypothetical protein
MARRLLSGGSLRREHVILNSSFGGREQSGDFRGRSQLVEVLAVVGGC